MIRIHHLGTCAGTEPIPGMHHVAMTLEIRDSLYWVDAGENCFYTAYTAGTDVTKSRAVLISHAHIDHTGGLPNLLFTLQKMGIRYGKKLAHDNTLVFLSPDPGLLDATKAYCNGGEAKDAFPFRFDERIIGDGLIYQDENLTVTALHNRHLKEDGSRGWHSYSFLLESEGKRIVYSGDVVTQEELDPLMEGGCHMLIMETGHHTVDAVCRYAASRGAAALRFTHNGREIIEKRPEMEALCADHAARTGMDIRICFDGMIENV